MNAFKQAVSIIFKDENFLEEFVINTVNVPCICSAIEDGVIYSDAGLENSADFTLDVQLPALTEIKINDVISFRGKQYKISHLTTDSANASMKLHLEDLTQR